MGKDKHPENEGNLHGEVETSINLKELRQDREHIKASLRRFIGFLDTFTEDKIENLELRLRKIEEVLLKDFNQVQRALEKADPSELRGRERDDFEDLYYACTGRGIRLIRNYYDSKPNLKLVPSVNQNTNQSFNQSNNNTNTATTSNKGLPTIELIKFHGEYEKWAQFRDLFKTLIHEDKSINKVRKFYYLLSSLKGEASRVLESIEITEDNYDLAWGLLTERYENKALTIKNHVKALFELPTVSKGYRLRYFLDEFQKRFRALKLLGEPVDSWSTLLIHIITTKLDYRTLAQWEEFSVNKKLKTLNLNDLLDFLSDRCKCLETTENHFVKQQDKFDSARNPAGHRDKPKNQSFTAQTGKYVIECAFCKAKHYIYHCEKFINLPIASRIEKIKKLKLCFNCLRANHSCSDCFSQGCKLCSKKHNTLLHETNDKLGQPNGDVNA